jgi:hypothetical protein
MQTSNAIERSPRNGWSTHPVWGVLRQWFSGWRGLLILGLALVVAGLAMGWSWLTAIGVAPLILSLAPCAAMCAIGVCAMSRGGASCANSGTSSQAEKSGSADVSGTDPHELN